MASILPTLLPTIISAIIDQANLPSDPATTPMSPPPGVIRMIPDNTHQAIMGAPSQGFVTLGNETKRLSIGAQIRDANNRIVLPVTIRRPVLVRYSEDNHGNVHRIWILTQAEAALQASNQ